MVLMGMGLSSCMCGVEPLGGNQGLRKLRPSVDLEREMGKEGLLVMGVFFLDILTKASWMVLKGSLFSESRCQQLLMRSCSGTE